MKFREPEVDQEYADEHNGSPNSERLHTAPQIGAQTNGNASRGRHLRLELGEDLARKTPWSRFRLDRDRRQVSRLEYPLPHLEGARRVSSDLEIVGDQDKSEGIALLQALEQVDNVAFGVLVEVACRFVGQQ